MIVGRFTILRLRGNTSHNLYQEVDSVLRSEIADIFSLFPGRYWKSLLEKTRNSLINTLGAGSLPKKIVNNRKSKLMVDVSSLHPHRRNATRFYGLRAGLSM